MNQLLIEIIPDPAEQHMLDIKYLQESLFKACGIPKKYLGLENDIKSSLTNNIYERTYSRNNRTTI